MKKISLILSFIYISVSASVFAQGLKMPAASTTQTISQDFALSQIKISYSRPNVKGRTIFGDLVPYGQVWRTGANSPTKITFGEDVSFEGQRVAAGEYALYTIPGQTEWTIILSKNTKLWGAMGYQEADDLLRVKVKPVALSQNLETFTVNFANIMANTCDLQLSWDKTLISVKIGADVDTKIMSSIDAAMQTANKPYYQAASYYFDNGKDLKKALIWIEEATKANPKAYYMEHLKAKILLKSGMKAEAIASANRSMQVAEAEKNQDYVILNQKLIAEANKSK